MELRQTIDMPGHFFGLLPIAALLALTAAAFANALGVSFLFDDIGDIVGNVSASADTVLERLPYTNRPLTKLSYAINDALHGAMPSGYAAVSIALHLAAVVLAVVLARRAFAGTGEGRAVVAACAAVALWAVHPALTESVTYLSGRSMVLSGALMLAALAAVTAARPRPWLAFLCAALAPLARETALVLPLMVLWWQWTIGAPAGRAWPVWLGTALAGLVIALMPHHRDLIAYSLELRDPVAALRGNLHAATETLAFWFTPWRVTIFPEAPPPYAWTEGPTLIRLAGFVLAAALAIALRRRVPVFAFGVGFALLALAPAQSIIWRADPVALKPLYLAGLGLSFAMVELVRRAASARIALAAALVLAVPLGVMTFERNLLFRSAVTLAADAVATTPDNAAAWYAYGAALMGEGRFEEAETALTRALDLKPHDERAMNLLQLIATIRGVGAREGDP